MHTVCTLSENADIGIYAPITKPETADKIPKNAPHADEVLKSGTSIGANVREGIRGQTKADFYAKFNVSLKEASETEYWLELLNESGYLEGHENDFQSLHSDCQEVIRILMAITKTQKKGGANCNE